MMFARTVARLPFSYGWLIGEMHWRDAVQVLGCLPIVLIPVLYFLVRERPADPGVQPIGGESGPRTAPAGSRDIDMSEVWAQVRTFNFVLLALIAALIFYTANAFILTVGFMAAAIIGTRFLRARPS